MGKKLTAAAVVIIFLAGISLYLRYSKQGLEHGSVRTSGIVEGVEVRLSAKVPGRIAEICCREGDRVREGQAVIRIESDDLRASVEQAEAEIRSLEADAEMAEVQMDQARKDADRAKALYQSGFISSASLDQAASDYDKVAAAYRSAKERLKVSDANLAYHRSRLNDAAIISPISGAVVFKAMEKGETAGAGETILTIVNMDDLYVRADIEETLIGSLTLGSETFVKAAGIPGRVFKARVTEVGRYAEFATQKDVTRGRQDIRTFRVKSAVEDPAGLLKPGMTVEIEFPGKE